MSVLPFKRFIICYKIIVNNECLKQPPIIVKFRNELEATEKTCNRLNIPNNKVDRNGSQPGYIYCNEIYNSDESLLIDSND